MYTLQLTVSQGSAPICKASAGPCSRCPPSTSGRPFGSSPCVDRNHSKPGPSTEGVLQTLPGIMRAAQRSVRFQAVRGNKQDKTNKSSEQPAVSHWLHFCRRHCFHCFNPNPQHPWVCFHYIRCSRCNDLQTCRQPQESRISCPSQVAI